MQSIFWRMLTGAPLDVVPNAEEVAFRQWFGLSQARARMLCALWRARGKIVASTSLGLTRRSVYVYVCDLRAALNPGAIYTRSKSGYALTPAGLEECQAALLAMCRCWSEESATPTKIAA